MNQELTRKGSKIAVAEIPPTTTHASEQKALAVSAKLGEKPAFSTAAKSTSIADEPAGKITVLPPGQSCAMSGDPVVDLFTSHFARRAADAALDHLLDILISSH